MTTRRTSPAPSLSDKLADWIWPLSLTEFLEGFWRQRLWASEHSGLERLKLLSVALGPFDVDSLLTHTVSPVRVWYSDNGRPDHSLSVSTDIARQLYRAGLTLYFHLDGLQADLSDFFRSLGHPPGRTRLSIFASRRTNVTPAHVDGNENFTVQLAGMKRWHVWNDPTYSTSLSDPCCEGEPSATTVDLTAGSVLYVPGTWLHETLDLEDSISLNLSLSNVSWAELVTTALGQMLQRDARWAAPAFGLWGDGQHSVRGHAVLTDLVQSLGLVSNTELAEAIYTSAMRPQSGERYQKHPLAVTRVVKILNNPHRVSLVVSTGHARSSLNISTSQLPVCRWISQQQAPFRLSDVPNFTDSMAEGSANAFVSQLLRSGFILRA